MKRTTGRSALMVLLVLAACCTLGGIIGGRARAEADKSDALLQSFGRALAIVEENYVGKVESKAMVEDAVQGMLHTLDPHSNYLDKDAYNEMKDEQRGKFFGLGIQINKPGPDKPLTIIAPIDGTPASRAGLQAGDIISRIEGSDTISLSVQEAVRRLKGEKGTKVTITIQRPREDAPFDVTLIRDEIPTHSITLAYMVRPGTGFIRLANFTSTTATELDEAVKHLEAQGMARLILDLRRNPGGLLEQAVQVAERFIPAGKMIVYTRGRVPGSDQDYPAAKDVDRIDAPLVVLVDHASASASEIVSGAIQDHDRGLVVGETTFGKGLVQRVIPLHGGGAVALTTAKYFTPSGRLIQRDYSDLDDYFLEPEEEAEAPAAEAQPAPDRRETKHTDSGRTVYGGGGITPDYVVRAERALPVLSRLVRDNLILDFAVRYVPAHPDLKPEVPVDAAFRDEVRHFLESKSIPFDAAMETAWPQVELQLRAQIAKVKWGVEAQNRILSDADPQVRKALTLFDEASRLAAAGERSREVRERASSPASSI
ncbi:MAG: S41 family peptidase [Acidobacteriia bacterium]|nr:S41 family peptidase [Terriglobia bacterium]